MTEQDEHFPGFPNLRRFVTDTRYGDMELLSVDETSDGFLIGQARIHMGEDCEHIHGVFLGRAPEAGQ